MTCARDILVYGINHQLGMYHGESFYWGQRLRLCLNKSTWRNKSKELAAFLLRTIHDIGGARGIFVHDDPADQWAQVESILPLNTVYHFSTQIRPQ